MSVKNKDYDAVCDESDRLRERIEELEQHNRTLQSVVSPQTVRSWHVTTHEQIAAAVVIAEANRYRNRKSDGAGWNTINELNIFRCEGCGGSGKTHSRTGSMKEEPMEWICPDCNGKGYLLT